MVDERRQIHQNGDVLENVREVDIIKIEEEIDKAIENEDYETLDRLLELRGELLVSLSPDVLREIYERDRVREEKLRKKMLEFKAMAQQMEAGKKLASSQSQDEKGTYLDSGA